MSWLDFNQLAMTTMESAPFVPTEDEIINFKCACCGKDGQKVLKPTDSRRTKTFYCSKECRAEMRKHVPVKCVACDTTVMMPRTLAAKARTCRRPECISQMKRSLVGKLVEYNRRKHAADKVLT